MQPSRSLRAEYSTRTDVLNEIKMPSDWSNESVIKFLELLEAESCIWDVKNPNHKLKHKVHDAWRRVSDALEGTPIEELKAKKKSLMATFRPLLKKKQTSNRSGAGTDEIFQPIWFAYDIMERFLGTSFTVVETMNTEDTKEQLIPDDETPSMTLQQTGIEDSQIIHKTAKKTNSVKKTHLNQIINEADEKLNESFATLSRALEKKKAEEDECDVYAKLLAKKLRKYPERMRDKIMYKIDGLLLDNPYPDNIELMYAPAPSPQYAPTPSPQYAPIPSPQYAPTPSPQYALNSTPKYAPSPSPQYAPTPSPQYAPTPSPQYAPTPSPQYAPTPSPQYAPTPSPQYAPTPSPQYAPTPSLQYTPNPSPQDVNVINPQFIIQPNSSSYVHDAPVEIHIPEDNINPDGRIIQRKENKVHILSQKVFVSTKMNDLIDDAFKSA